jgi:hypothetical protein
LIDFLLRGLEAGLFGPRPLKFALNILEGGHTENFIRELGEKMF